MGNSDGVTRTVDPTKSVLAESALNEKHLCDYNVNVATGCSNGCRFCYVPATPNIRMRPDMLADHADVADPQTEWGSYVLYREHIPSDLPGKLDRKRTWKETPGGQGIVGISFHTDCFMDHRAAEITLQTVRILTDRGYNVRVLTRGPMTAATYPIRRDPAGRVTMRGVQTLANAGDQLVVGSSINSLDDDAVAAIETSAPSIQSRLTGLQRLADAGIQTYISMSPTYPTMTRSDMAALLDRVAETDPGVIFHEPINPRSGNYQQTVDAAWAAGEDDLGAALARLRNRDNWVDYALTHFRWVQEIGMDRDLPVHLWPDKQLIDETSGAVTDWLQAWRDRQSPESFAGRPTPDSPPPAIPDDVPDGESLESSSRQTRLSS